MNADLLNKTKKQVVDLLHNNFHEEADQICEQAQKVFDDLDLVELQIVAKIGNNSFHDAEKLAEYVNLHRKTSSNLNNLSVIKRNLNKIDEAINYGLSAIEMDKSNPNYYANLSGIYWDIGRKKEAYESLESALSICPNNSELAAHKASYLFTERKTKQAIIEYKKAIKLSPKNPAYYVEMFYCLSILKKYYESWGFYEYRYQSMRTVSLLPYKFNLPVLYEKKDFYEEKIAIIFEQGMGDCIMYLRFLQSFFNIAPNSYLLCNDAKFDNLDALKSLPIEKKIQENTKGLLGIMSLPYHLGIKDIPPPMLLGKHEPKSTDKLKIGIVWAGSAYHPMDHTRSTYFEDFAFLCDENDVEVSHFMVDLRKRKRIGNDQTIDYACNLEKYTVKNYGQYCKTLNDTIKYLNEVDVLISVDTSIVHIAGSIQMPTYILVSEINDWRWGMNESVSDWYPTVTILRKDNNKAYSDLIIEAYKKIRDDFSRP